MALKIAHLNVVRGFPGLLKQLEYEENAAKHLDGVEWDVHLYVEEDADQSLANPIPTVWRGIFRRKLFAWIWLLKNSRRYDYVLVRHIEFDPFALLFAWFIRNRVLVFHAKSEKELRLIRRGWKGWAAAKLEGFSGRVAARTASAILGVTNDIREYEVRNRALGEDFASGIYPNGILVESVPVIDDLRPTDAINIAFMCGSFAEWHGLDIIMDALFEEEKEQRLDESIVLHLIGDANEKQIAAIREFQGFSSKHQVIWYSSLCEKSYRSVFSECHVGLGSLAMYRNDLEEGATLKVREMLAMGVPVYSGHRDTAIPDEFPYYRIHQGNILKEIIDFSYESQGTQRETIRERARPLVDKSAYMKSVSDFLAGLKRN